MGKERLHYIDVAKGLLILMVVFGHLYGFSSGVNNAGVNYLHQLSNIFVSFYMPCFFVVTGYCSNFSKGYLPFLGKSFKSILFPGIVLGFLILLLRDFSIENLKCYIYDLLFYGGRYWFLTALFLSRIIYWVGNRYVAPKALYVICILLFISGYLLGIYYQGMEYWWFIHVLLLMPYLALGQCMRQKNFLDRYNLKTAATVYVSSFFLTVFLCHKGLLQRDYFYHVPGITRKLLEINLTMFIPLVLLSVSGSLLLLNISKAISHNRLIEFFGKNSLVVYCVHGAILGYAIPKIGGGNYDVCGFLLVMIVAYLFTLIVSGVIAHLFNQKYLKVIIGKF